MFSAARRGAFLRAGYDKFDSGAVRPALKKRCLPPAVCIRLLTMMLLPTARRRSSQSGWFPSDIVIVSSRDAVFHLLSRPSGAIDREIGRMVETGDASGGALDQFVPIPPVQTLTNWRRSGRRKRTA